MPSVKSVALASAVLLLAVTETSALSSPAVHGMRRHSPVQKRRLYEPRQVGVIPGSEETTSSATDAAATSSSVATTSSQVQTSSTSNILDTLTGGTSTTSSTVATTSSTTVASTTSSAAPTSTTSVNANTATSSSAIPTSASAQGTSTVNVKVTVTQSSSATSSATIEEKKTNGGATFGKNSIIAIAVIASCIGAAVGIWTLIRKWKLSPSRKFNSRMQPIEWTPEGDSSTAGAGVVPVRPPAEKDAYSTYNDGATEKGFRRTSGSSHTGSDGGRNVTGNQSLAPDAPPLPPHDFTAGPAHYGHDGGYVDLQRGNSVNHGYDYGATGANLNRAPTLSRSDHDDPYAQDAYGGYDAYSQGHQQHYAQNATGPAYGDAYGHNTYGDNTYGAYQPRGQSGY